MQCTMVRHSVKLELRVDSAGESVVEPIKKKSRQHLLQCAPVHDACDVECVMRADPVAQSWHGESLLVEQMRDSQHKLSNARLE